MQSLKAVLDPMDDPSAEAGANRLRDSEPVPTSAPKSRGRNSVERGYVLRDGQFI